MIYLFDSGATLENKDCVEAYAVNQEPQDYVGHGTCMASVIKSINPLCEIYSVKIGDSNPKLNTVYLCLDYLAQRVTSDQDILLFNANFNYSPELSLLESRLSELSKKFLIIVPAGNNAAPVDLYSPARCPFVLTVGSLNKSKKITSVSNLSGNKIIDLWVVSTNTPAFDRAQKQIRLFGTSVAASITAALADLHKVKDKDKLQEIITNYNNSVAFYETSC